MDSITIDDVGEFKFAGAVGRAELTGVWTWLARDIAPDLIDRERTDIAEALAAQLTTIPTLLARAEKAVAAASKDLDAERRLKVQLGSTEVWERLRAVLNALKCLPLIEKAKHFGRVINDIGSDEALVNALQSIPRGDANVAAVLLTAAVSEIANPSRLVVAATKIAGGASEPALLRMGLAPLIDACLAQAQNTIPPLLQVGGYIDMDLMCHAIERFHRLTRAITANIEVTRGSRWATIIAALTKIVSDKLEPRLRDVTQDLHQALRPPRDNVRQDADGMLSVLNGFYLLATVRDCRDSLALNKVFDECWSRTGQALEMYLERATDALRSAPTDKLVLARFDAGLKMAELRFGQDFVQVLKRSRDSIGRRQANSG
ncbi:MAG TPA: hypothetical protein VL418_11655 [Devosiaceae bacterium]|nr:hypothetical protein [Devosiaceae bacterium]